MSHSVCPFWMGYFLLCPVRRFGQNPEKILSPYVGSGMTVLDIGPGMGFFTLPMARLVGPTGKVVCLDVQLKMLDAVRHRADKAEVADRIETRVCEPMSLGIGDLAGKVDVVLLFAVVHEVPDTPRLFREIAQAMRPGARCLVAEPKLHVSERDFEQTIATANEQGLELAERPVIWGSRTGVFTSAQP